MAEIILNPADMKIDKPTIEEILRVVPEEDLKGLKEIVITYLEYAFTPSNYDPRHGRVVVLIDPFFGICSSEDLARVLYHEIAHHVQYGSPYWRKMWREIGKQQMDRNYAPPDPEADISKFEGFARSYADEKLKKLRQTDPEILNPWARPRVLNLGVFGVSIVKKTGAKCWKRSHKSEEAGRDG